RMSTDLKARPAATQGTVVPPVRWRNPVLYAVATVVSLVVFALLTDGGQATTFRFAAGGEAVALPNVAVPSVPAIWALTLLMAGLAGYAAWAAVQRRRVGWWLPALFGLAFVLAFL